MSKRVAQFTFLASILLPFGTAYVGSFFTIVHRYMVEEARAAGEAEFLAYRRSLHHEAEQALLEASTEEPEKLAPVFELIAQTEELWIEKAKVAGEEEAAAERSALALTPVAYFYYLGNLIFYGGIFCGAPGTMGHLFRLESKARKDSGS